MEARGSGRPNRLAAWEHRHIPRHLLLLLAVLTVGVACALAGWGIDLAPQQQNRCGPCAPPSTPFPIRFDPSVPYDDALQVVTDLGLQPSVACGYDADMKAGRVITDMHWQPAGQRSIFPVEHRLFVALTPLTAPDWITRLNHAHGVMPNHDPEQSSQPLYCPDINAGGAAYSADRDASHPAQASLVLTYAQATSSPNALVVFTPSSTYAEALYAMSNLGMRLADPCYEHAHAGNRPASAPWPGVGQEQRFSASHTLLVAAAPLTTPSNWDQMISSQTDVASVTVPYTASC